MPEVSRSLAQRVQELREELAEAESFHDVGRIARLQVELEEVTDTLLRQTRSQQKASPSTDERLRLNVSRAIKTAIKKITTVHPPLGRYLTQSIKTGTLCSYSPSDSSSIDWQV
jgi:non-specific serine/threonine protein kinase